MNKRVAQGQGSIRQKKVLRNGQEYTYWEGRATIDGIQRSVSAKTQAECVEKLKALQRKADDGLYIAPSKMTVSQWLDTWLSEFCKNVKPRTLEKYQGVVDNQIKPAIGKIKLTKLRELDVQRMCDNLKNKKTGKALSPKSVKDVHGTLHKALQVAIKFKILKRNVADKINLDLPKVTQAEIKPLDTEQIGRLYEVIQKHKYRDVYLLGLLTGMRQGELCGLSWKQIDFAEGTITVSQQLQIDPKTRKLVIAETKNSKIRTIYPAKAVMELLERRKKDQFLQRIKARDDWKNEYDLVFTHENGRCVHPHSVYDSFKVFAKKIGCPNARFHDLRHTFATIALANGDDIKTVSETMGHYAASFTLAVYGHSTDAMKKESSKRMDNFIASTVGVA